MNAERWREVEQLYHSALEQPPEHQSSFLEKACHGNEELRGQVETLLRHDRDQNGVLDSPAWGIVDNTRTPLRPGSRIDHYEILSLLGAGGMGEVYCARDTRLERTVAIKVLPTDTIADEQRKRRFIQESKAASALNHPNIVAIYDIFTEEETDFLVMEYVPGKSLDRLIGGKGLRTSKALAYAIQIADALSASHTAGIVHRDLKPSNVMITPSETNHPGTVKLLDFGIAKLTEKITPGDGEVTTTQGPPSTREGSVLGTAPYMSPEQAQGTKIDGRSDIFSFGSVLHEMVTGRRAFSGDSELSTLSSIVRDEPKAITQLRPGIPRELERIIRRCLRKDPERRFQTAADLKVALQEVKDDLASSEVMADPPERRRLRRLAAVIAGLTLALLGAIAVWRLGGAGKARSSVLTATPLTTYPGSERYPTFSPDGSQVAFSWVGEDQGNEDIYVKMIAGGSPLRLTTDAAEDFSPAWSPDGSSIAFMRSLPGGMAAVMLISPLGSDERKLVETRDVARRMWLIPRTLAWTPDGKYLALRDAPAPGEPPALFLHSIESGGMQRLTHPPLKSGGDSDPAFSPDGRMLAFVRGTGGYNGELFVSTLAPAAALEGKPKQLTFDNRRVINPAWMPDTRRIVFSSNRAGEGWLLWRIGVQGGQPERLESVGEDGLSAAILPRGNRLAYTRGWWDYNIWRVDLASVPAGAAPAMLKKSSVAVSSRADRGPRLSPDGKRIAFESDRSGTSEIWVCDSFGPSCRQLTKIGAYSGSPRWSPDGERIAFDSNVSGRWQIYVMDANSGKREKLTDGGGYAPAWSRGGKWIYFSEGRQVWKVPSSGGDALPVTRTGGSAPMESPDGKFLYYMKNAGELWRSPVGGGGETRILEGVTNQSFDVVEDGIYFIATGTSGPLLQFYSFTTKKTTLVDTIGKPVYFNIDVSPDRRSILYSQRDQQVEDLMLVENFR